MVYSSRRIGLPGGLINTGTRAAGDLWTRVQAHPWSDQSTSRPGCVTWPAPAAPTTRLEPLLWFPLRPPRPHRSLGYTPLTISHRGSCAAWGWPQIHLQCARCGDTQERALAQRQRRHARRTLRPYPCGPRPGPAPPGSPAAAGSDPPAQAHRSGRGSPAAPAAGISRAPALVHHPSCSVAHLASRQGESLGGSSTPTLAGLLAMMRRWGG